MKNICIVGGGTAGLISALMLKQSLNIESFNNNKINANINIK